MKFRTRVKLMPVVGYHYTSDYAYVHAWGWEVRVQQYDVNYTSSAEYPWRDIMEFSDECVSYDSALRAANATAAQAVQEYQNGRATTIYKEYSEF